MLNPQRLADLIESQRISLMAMALSAKRARVKSHELLQFWRLCLAANYELAKAAGVQVPSIAEIHEQTQQEMEGDCSPLVQ